ncbi:glutamate--cysteine ligase [Raineyella fluvialis]|uniref:Glutamate--cysteine ligase n=1 Tax=Raineyella fluvialis TaxID=2662261 RepID=A0A5Q2FG57_9ACTN|nr:glutamate--cysteine ligase [Raineyella fluvialis]QGF24787.1 glutamate--cysteine ligase [Raineyella fluvialis]
MGAEVEIRTFDRRDRSRYRRKVARDVAVLGRLLEEVEFVTEPKLAGLEVELNLVDDRMRPAMVNAQVLEAIDDDRFTTELGRFNIELNVEPRALGPHGLSSFEQDVAEILSHAQTRVDAADLTVRPSVVMIGTLPTLEPRHLDIANISGGGRYLLLNDQILESRQENILIDIRGAEHLSIETDSIMPEAACTSTQVHLQVSPDEFAAHWNAAQAIAGAQIVVGANSPFLFGRHLVAETRVPLFEQSTDTRSAELVAQGVRPRVWFGERWVDSIFDLFEENRRYFTALLPITGAEDPEAELEAGRVPRLTELNLHNGTIYRWNRPIFSAPDGRPHLRVENRVLPGGPTVVDTLANVAFFAGLVHALAHQDAPLWAKMSFRAAEDNFRAAVRDGIRAEQYWPGVGQVPGQELVVRTLLPLAAEGLADRGVAGEEIDRLLGIIERRCLRGRNGSSWQVAHVAAREADGLDRRAALRAMLASYVDLMRSNLPVHEWPLSSE